MESALQESTLPSSDLFTAWELDNLTAEQLSDPAINQKARASLVALSKAKQEQKSSVYQEVREEDRLSPELRKELDESLATDKVVDETLTDNVVTTSVIDQTFGNEGGIKTLDDLLPTDVTKEMLIDTASTSGKGGVTPIGRAFQKHNSGNRAGTFVGEVTGNTGKNTQQGLNYLNDILGNPIENISNLETSLIFDCQMELV